MISEKDYQRSMNIITRALERAPYLTKEEALQMLVDSGILDTNGNFTKPYENLGRFINSQK